MHVLVCRLSDKISFTQIRTIVQVKFTAYRDMKGGRGRLRYSGIPFLTLELQRVVVYTMSRLLYPQERDRCPSYKRPGGPWSQSGWVQRTSPSQGFEPSAVQPIGRHLYNSKYVIIGVKCCTSHNGIQVVCPLNYCLPVS